MIVTPLNTGLDEITVDMIYKDGVLASHKLSVEVKSNIVLGDLNENGVVDITDLSVLAIHLVDKTEFTEQQEKAADLDHDGIVGLTDLAKFRQYISKVIDFLE